MTIRFALLLVLLASVGATLAGPSGDVLVLELKNGTKYAGRIEESQCDDKAIVLWLLRPRRKLVIPWTDVVDAQAHKIRVQLGFEVEEESAGVTVKAHRIKNRAGSTFIGILENAATAEQDGIFVLKTADGTRRIPASDVREGPTEVEVDALMVYTPRELYDQRIAQGEPKTARDHFRLAEFCRTVGAFEQAKLHYGKVLEFEDSQYPEASIQRLLARVSKALESKEALFALKEIKRSIVFKNWPKANELIQAFREAYAEDEAFLEELSSLEDDLVVKREQHYIGLVYRSLMDEVKDLLGDKVKQKTGADGEALSIREAQQYAGGEPSTESTVSFNAVQLLAEEHNLTSEEVLDYWSKRPKRSAHKAFYRRGTFIVLESLQDALARAPKASGKKKGAKPPKPHPPNTPDRWWKTKVAGRKYSEMRDFLFAWWAENSGMTELLEPKYETCPTCAGKGYTQAMVQTSQGTVPFYDRCQTCYMATKFRVVRFK